MSVSKDILRSYVTPRKVYADQLSIARRESDSLFLLMLACGLFFVAQWPRLTRMAHMNEQELMPMLGGALLGWVCLAPLMLYVIAAVLHILWRVFGAKMAAAQSRFVIFWALLASVPIVLLHGLVTGFIGAGSAANLVGAAWLFALCLFIFVGMREAGWPKDL